SQSLRQQDRRITARDRWRVAIARGQASPDSSPDGPEWSSATSEEYPSRATVARAALENASLTLLDNLAKRGPLRLYLCGQRLREVPIDPAAGPAASLLPAFTAEDGRTALADAVGDLLAHRDGDPPAAVVVVTD